MRSVGQFGARRPSRRRRLARAALVLLSTVLLLAAAVITISWVHRPAAAAAKAAVATSATPSSPLTTTPTPTPSSAVAAAPARPSTRTLHVLGLGDSVTSGFHCDCTDYVTDLGRLLAQRDHRKVHTDNEAVPGATTVDVSHSLATSARLRRAVARADVVVVTVGANDLTDSLTSWRSGGCSASCYDPDITAMQRHLRALVLQLQALRSADPATILTTNYWNVFTDGRVAAHAERKGYLDWSDTVTRAANAAIHAADAAGGAQYVDLYTPFKGDGGQDPTRLLADDGDHPDAAGAALISRTVLAEVPPSNP